MTLNCLCLAHQAQSKMEAQIALVTAELRRLQAAESSVQPGRTENSSVGRAAHLEEQLNILMQQRLQHLETIQCQQIQLQVKMARPLSRPGEAESGFIFVLFLICFVLVCLFLFTFLFYFVLFYFCFYLVLFNFVFLLLLFFCILLFCFLFFLFYLFNFVLFCLFFCC